MKKKAGQRSRGMKKKSAGRKGAGEHRPAPLGDVARDAAVSNLARQAGKWPAMDAEGFVWEGISGRDEALGRAIYDAGVRRWLTLEWLIGLHLKQEFGVLEPRLRGVLIAGAAQLVFMDRLPAHAVINHSVEWAKVRIRPGAGAVVNAVLRRVSEVVARDENDQKVAREAFGVGGGWARDELPTEDGGAIVLREAVLPADDVERIAVATSHPVELIQRWARERGMLEARKLALHGVARPAVVFNTMHAKGELDGQLLVPHDAPGHHVFVGEHEELVTLLGARRDIWVQDPASSLAVGSVGDLQPGLIVDLCAGQGTKTRQLAATFPDAKIVATDTHAGRFETLKQTFAKSEQVEVVAFGSVRERYAQAADLVLLDVPCSNTGVLARRVEARYRFSRAYVEEVTGVQRQIVADSVALLRPRRGGQSGGRGQILYSTCSLEREENEEIAAWGAKWHGMRVSREHRRMPGGVPGGEPASYSDGSYAVLLG